MSPNVPGIDLIKPLGNGGYAGVFLIEHDGRKAALKMLLSPASDARERFIREAQMLEQLRGNPHIVTVLYARLDAEPLYYIMEYCELGSLRSWVEHRRPWPEVAQALWGVANALLPFHRGGGFHRDIKPDNILWKEEGGRRVTKLADYGVARSHEESNLTRSWVGTERYTAPEVRQGGDYAQAADVFSLGLTGIEVLTGEVDIVALAKADCPPALKALLFRMVSADPSKRPTIAEFIEELKGIEGADVEPTPQTAVTNRTPEGVPPRAEAGPTPSSVLLPPIKTSLRPIPPIASKAARSATQGGDYKPGWLPAVVGALAAGAAVLAAGTAYGTSNSWDATTDRYRGSDGKFRKGRWR